MMGGQIQINNKRALGNEFIADISVMSSTLHGISIPEDLVSIAIDEFPCIFIAAAVAKGKTVLKNAAELRIKESDRIQVMAAGLHACGIQVETLEDGLVIHGGKLKGGNINAEGDHRVAMAFTMASLAASEKIHISDTRNISTSFPEFVKYACSSGIQIEIGS
jgi:3-phosphoshikimate 1-carboxyvinyltransferase